LTCDFWVVLGEFVFGVRAGEGPGLKPFFRCEVVQGAEDPANPEEQATTKEEADSQGKRQKEKQERIRGSFPFVPQGQDDGEKRSTAETKATATKVASERLERRSWLEGGEDVFGIGADAVVGVGFGEGDLAGGGDSEGGGDGEAPGVGALIAVDEGDVDHDGSVVLLHGLGNGVGDVEGVGEDSAGVGEQGIGEVVVLGGEVVLARELRRDGDQQCALFADGGESGLPGFELGHAVGAPAAAKEDDDERADAEQVCGVHQTGIGGGGVGERGGRGVGEIEAGSGGADGEDAVFDAGEEEGLDGFIGDGEAAGLDQGAGLGGDVVELGLEVGGMRHLA